MLAEVGVPVSEFVLQAYVRDAMFRRDMDFDGIMKRLVPSPLRLNRFQAEMLAGYMIEYFRESKKSYSVFTDQSTGPLRRDAAILHTATIARAAQLEKSTINPLFLPKHTFIILSQIQRQSASTLEVLSSDEEPSSTDIDAMYDATENMTDALNDLNDMIERSFDRYRQSRLSLVSRDPPVDSQWRTAQISVAGTDVWRRLVLPMNMTLTDLSELIVALFNWSGEQDHKFIFNDEDKHGAWFDANNTLKETLPLSTFTNASLTELAYEYGPCWRVRTLLLATYDAAEGERVHCITGENAPPPEDIEGPLRFHRFVQALASHNEDERAAARVELGMGFRSDRFSVTQCNEQISAIAAHLAAGASA
jgi:hypothetical protein